MSSLALYNMLNQGNKPANDTGGYNYEDFSGGNNGGFNWEDF
jgi:hypothetical protein